ncbi:MAG: hypothetical protein WC551_13645 [Patescibacteria group bacterium]
MDFEEARDVQTVWKAGALIEAACQLVRAGLIRLDAGEDYFGPDDIPEAFTAGGQGITGSAVHMLRAAGILQDYDGSHAEAGVFHGRRRSRRESANGRKVCLYQLTGRGLAEAFLSRYGQAVELRQMVMEGIAR